MKRLHRTWPIDFLSSAAAFAALILADVQWWVFLLTFLFGMCQKYDGRQQVKHELGEK